MNTTKTLALAAMTALSLGVGTAMAQSNTVAPNPYAVPQASAPQTSVPTTRTQENTVQYGSSDHVVPGAVGLNTDPIAGGF